MSGKSALAAMFMARTRSLARMAIELWRQWSSEPIAAGRIAEAVNRELCQNNGDRMFVTLFLGLLDTRNDTLTYVNAGHPLPHLLHASGHVGQLAEQPDMPLGVRPGTAYQARTAALRHGDAILVVTDRVTEAMNPQGALCGADRLAAVLRAADRLRPQTRRTWSPMMCTPSRAQRRKPMTCRRSRCAGSPRDAINDRSADGSRPDHPTSGC